MTPYPGNPSYIVDISVMDDGDPDVAATYAVPIEQLADRTAYLKDLIDGGIGFEFTDAILHGDTTFPDGTIDATLTALDIDVTGNINIGASLDITIAASDDLTLAATDQAVFGGNTATIGGTVAVNVNTALLNVISGKFMVTGSKITLDEDTDFSNGTFDFKVSSAVIMRNGLTFNTGGQVSTNQDVEMTLGGKVSFWDEGHIAYRKVFASTDANQSITATTDVFIVPAGLFSGGHDGTIANGLSDGQVIRCVSFDTANELTMKNFDGSNIKTPENQNLVLLATPVGPGDYRSFILIWNLATSKWLFLDGNKGS